MPHTEADRQRTDQRQPASGVASTSSRQKKANTYPGWNGDTIFGKNVANSAAKIQWVKLPRGLSFLLPYNIARLDFGLGSSTSADLEVRMAEWPH